MDKESLNNYKRVSIASLLVGVLMFGAVSYAYLRQSTLLDKKSDLIVEVKSGSFSLKYKECKSGQEGCSDASANIGIGESLEKTFSIINDGTLDVKYDLLFLNLLNSFNNDAITYELIDETSNEVILRNVVLPYSQSEIHDVSIIDDMIIKGNTTKNYKLVITYNDVGNHSLNKDSSFEIKTGIKNIEKAE